MLRSARGLLAQVFVVLAIVALASIALAPRGMLRATVAEDLDLTLAQIDGSTTLDAPSDAVHLPGMRAVVSREEQDLHDVLLDALTTGPVPGAPVALVPPRSGAADEASPQPSRPAPASAHGERAPPSSV